MATWIAYIPIVKDRFVLSDGALGVTLLAGAVGSIATLIPSGWLIGRFGSRRIAIVMTLGYCLTVPIIVLTPSYPVLVGLLFVAGGCVSSMDVAMNAQAVAVENRHGQPLMSAFHGTYSVAALFGAGFASLMLSAGIAPVLHVAGVAIAMSALAVVAGFSLLPAEIDQTAGGSTLVWPTGSLISLGIIGLLALVSEGAMSDWGAVYLHEILRTTPAFAATGFAAFSLTMALGRFAGDPLRARVPAVRFLRLSGAVAATGLGITLLAGNPVVTLLGFAAVGIGLSNVVPVVFSAAGQTPGVPTGTAVAAVATAGYLGFIVGPPTIGFVAEATSLPFGLGVVVGAIGLIAVLAGRAHPADALPDVARGGSEA